MVNKCEPFAILGFDIFLSISFLFVYYTENNERYSTKMMLSF